MDESKATWKRRKVEQWDKEQQMQGREEDGRKEWERLEFTCRKPCEPSGTNGWDGKVECFDRNELWCKMWKSAKDVSELLGINESQAILMLKATCWDEEKLLDQYLLRAEQLCEKAGLPPPTGHTDEYLCSKGKKMFVCVICANAGELLVSSLSCQHFYCNDCWQTYLNMKVKEGETAVSCPHFSCSRRCTPKFFQQLCTKDTFQKYEHFLLNAYVEETSWLMWCPFPGCGLVVHPKTSQKFAQCTKGHAFCTCCKEEFHAPATCDVVKEWNQKCQDDTETAHWLVANTKNCPNCSCTIEKDGGCNHMKCYKCKHEFCWVCMGDWVLHTDNYTCNRYDPGQAKTDNYKVKNAKGILNRYLFYYHRFMNHWQSLRLDKKTRARAELKMSQYAELSNGSLWSDFSFIGEAVEKLLKCRQTLKWTYVFAWKMEEDSPGRALFCYLQENLEIKTELLSGLLERSIADMMKESVRGRIMDLAQVTYQARFKLLDGISCG